MGEPEVAIPDRPWTVYALVVLSLAGLVWGQIVDVERTLWDVAAVTIGLFLTWGLWTGKQAAFSISFMLSSLCGALALGALLIQAFLMEAGFNIGMLVTGVVAIIWVLLLLRPETKRFAHLKQTSVWADSTSDESSPVAWAAIVAFVVLVAFLALAFAFADTFS